MADVGDAIGPADDLSFRRGRGRAAPRVVADAIECLAAQIEWNERDIGTPDRVVEAAVHVRRQCILAGMAAGAVSAIVSEGDGFGECDIEAERTGDRDGDLSDFESMSEPRALVVVGEHEHLGLAGQSTERGGVEDAIAVALEAGSERIGFLGNRAMSGTDRSRGEARELCFGEIFTILALECSRLAATRPGVGVGDDDRFGTVAGHGARPTLGALGDVSLRHVVLHEAEVTSGVWQ